VETFGDLVKFVSALHPDLRGRVAVVTSVSPHQFADDVGVEQEVHDYLSNTLLSCAGSRDETMAASRSSIAAGLG
jgi:hypothetical protein